MPTLQERRAAYALVWSARPMYAAGFPRADESVTSQSIAICCVTAAYSIVRKGDEISLTDRRCHSAFFWVRFEET
jgi:hypothetical protein